MFEKILKRSSWTDIIISIIFILFGLLMLVKPEATVDAISAILGIVFIVMGVLKLVEYYTGEEKNDVLITIALVSIVFGGIVFFCSEAIMSLFRIILGLWIIVAGVMDLQTTLIWKEVKSPYWTVAIIFSLFMIIAGMIILISKDILVTTIGALIVGYSVLEIVDRLIFMKKIKDFKKDVTE